MPKIGDIGLGQDIGKHWRTKYIWLACIDCSKERWVQYDMIKHVSGRCRSCAGKRYTHPVGSKSPKWNGGRNTDIRGYISVWLSSDDFFAPMRTKRGYVLEHRLVVAKSLGRCLQLWEDVHHKNGIKDDNRYPENLQLVSDLGHKIVTLLEVKLDRQGKKIQELERMMADQTKQIKLLRWQIKEEQAGNHISGAQLESHKEE